MNVLLNRLAEPSTWGGLAGLALAVGQLYPPAAEWLTPVALAFGGAAGAMAEKGRR